MTKAPAEIVGLGLLVAALVIAPWTGLIYPFFVMQALCFAIFACAFNLLAGFGGLMPFGHAMFLGTGGYLSAHVAKVWGWPPEAAILLGMCGAGILAGVSGMIAIRRQGIYFSMTTLALAQMTYFLFLQAPFTHGEDGIQSVPRGLLFGLFDLRNGDTLYHVVLTIFALAFLVIYRIVHSPFGEVLKAIRENEPRALSLGYRPDRYKFIVFVLSGALSGLAGAVKVLVSQNASLTDVHWSMSGEVILMALVGGLGTMLGPVLGAFILVAMQQYLAQFGQWVTVLHGLIFMLCVLIFRRGVVGEIAYRLKRTL